MKPVVLSASKALLFMASFYGWGSLINRWSGNHKPSCWAYQSTLGISILITIGGILNAFNIANSKVLFALFLIGLGITVLYITRFFLTGTRRASGGLSTEPVWNKAANLMYSGLIILVFFFLVMALMPARSFNLHDDFHAYLMWPIRMLQTGSLGGNPFDHLGVSSLGSQSFMQGIFMTFGNMASVNVFDAIICLVLIMGILKELGELIEINPVFTIGAGLLAVFINPHYVNISSLYSGSAMLLGLVYASFLLLKSCKLTTTKDLILATVPCALFYAALLTLKTTYIFVVMSFWGGCFFFSLLLAEKKKYIVLASLSCALITSLLLFPWLSLYWDRYLQKIYYILNDISYVHGTTTSPPVPGDNVATLLSNREMFYGNTYLDYLGIIVMLFFAFVATGWMIWKKRPRQESILLITFLAVFISAIINYYGLQFLFGPARMVVRYSCPILIAAAPVAILLAGWFWSQGKNKLQTEPALKKTALVFAVILIISQLGNILTFQKTFGNRLQKAYTLRTLLSFPLAEDDKFKQYNNYALSQKAKERMLRIQETVPVEETIFAWTSMPFHFDFTRNPIYPINESGLAYNLLVMPFSDGLDQMREYFHEFGIRYIIWEYNFYGMKKPEKMGSLQNNLIDVLKGLISKSEVLFNDGMIIVFDIGQGK